MSRVHVRLFAIAREIAGTDEMSVAVTTGATAGAVLDAVIKRRPGLAKWKKHLRLAVNGAYARAADPVRDGDEIALIPPVSGG